MLTEDYAWLDHLPDEDDQSFGDARLDLHRAEQAFRPDMPNLLLVKLYGFLLIREQDQIWHPLLHLCRSLIQLRMSGPTRCPEEYKVDFQPDDYKLAIEAIQSEDLPDKNLLSMYFIAEDHAGGVPHRQEASRLAPKWKPVVTMAADQIHFRMTANRDIYRDIVHGATSLFERDETPELSAGVANEPD